MDHKVVRSKMKKGKPLMDDPIISRHVPETHWLKASTFQKMSQTYPVVYIKPDVGRKGTGVIRVKKLNDRVSEISYGQITKRVSSARVIEEIEKNIDRQKKYLVQQGIHLATYHQRPFDIRVMMHKPLKRWLATLMCAKVAPHRNSSVTNVAKGAKDTKLIQTLQQADQPLNVTKVMGELIDVSHQIVQVLSLHFPFQVLGLDMAVDQKGKVWFIEANTKPEGKGMVTDQTMRRKYREAKKLINKR